MDDKRISLLVKQFNGCIKYAPMIKDHPDWTDDECVAFARQAHDKAKAQLAIDPSGWNNGIPYCRNVLRPELM